VGYAWELGKVGELEKARVRWQELANDYERNHGAKDDRTLDCLVRLAETHEMLEEHHAARAIYERIAGPFGPIHADSRDKAGPDDPRTLHLGLSLGLTMERLGQLDAAHAMYQTVLDGYVRNNGPRHRKVPELQARIGDVLLKQGDAAGARARYSEALALLRKFPGPDDPDYLEVLGHDADAMAAMGRKVAARNQARNVAEALRRTLGQENGLTKRADAHVAQLTARRRSR
jgi:tetratricopeptide (TPR) repeat protein